MKNWQMMVALSLTLCAWAAPAWATGMCSDKQACASPNDTCQGSYCVPTAKLCTADGACQTWEKCDFTCPMGIGGGGSTGTVGGTVSADAGSATSSDGVSWSSTDAGSSGSGSLDGGSFPSAPDATGVPSPDADFLPPDGGPWQPPQSTCPKSPGVCVPVLSKVPTQAGCDALCKAVVPCNLSFGGGSSSGGSGGGTAPSADAGSTDPSYPDASSGGGGPNYPDVAQSDASATFDTNMPQIDAGPMDVTPGPDDMARCLAICSVWVLDQVAPTEFAGIEQCFAAQAPSGCSAIETNCKAPVEAFMKAAVVNDAWSLGMGGTSVATGGNDTGGSKDGDVTLSGNSDATGAGNADAGSGTPQNFGDTVGGDASADGGTSGGGGSGAPQSGCTAGTASSTAPRGLALLGLFTAALVLRRRRA